MKIAALDIGGTSIKAGEFVNGTLGEVRECPTNAKEGGEKVMQRAIDIISGFHDFTRIGISTAGQVDSSKGRIRYANENIPGYTGMEVKKRLEERFQVPVAVENDVNAAAIGEAVYGAGRGYSDFLCLTYGTGVGGAIVIDQKIYTGAEFSAGEFGGIITHASCRDAQKDIFSGCYERYASATALVENAKKIDPTLCSGREIFSRLKEEKVQKVVDEWIREITYGLTTLIHIFNPSCVVLGGGVMNQKYILDKLNQFLYNEIMSSYQDVVIKQAKLGNTAGLLGAVEIARELKI